MNKLRPFDKYDWMANGGATRGPNDEEPMIFSCDDFEVLADGMGVEVRIPADEDGSYRVFVTPEHDDVRGYGFNVLIAESLINKGELTPDYLESLNFQDLGVL